MLNKVINDIINRGNTVEIRKRKDDIVVYEVSRKVKHTIVLQKNIDNNIDCKMNIS